MFDQLHAPHVAALLFLLIEAIHGEPRDPPGLLGRPAARDLELHPLLEVKLKLFREFLFEAIALAAGFSDAA